MIDRSIPQSTWNQHIKRYQNKYQCRCDDIGIWTIRCKNGSIQPYSLEKKQLVAALDFQTGRQLTFFLKRLQYKVRCPFKITQSGDTDVCIMFHEDDLNKFVYLLKIRRKKEITAETREKLRQNLILARKKAENVR